MEVQFTSEMTVELIDHMGSDLRVCQAAWVSTKGELSKDVPDEKDPNKLIPYLVKCRHGSPFEHGAMTFFIKAPIFVWREFHRHRVFSYNEESARYKTLDPVFYIPNENRPMFKVENWRAGRPKFLTIEEKFYDIVGDTPSTKDSVPSESYDKLLSNLKESYELAYDKYLDNLYMGIDPGLSRDCLPVGIYSSCWVTCNPRALMGFLSLRTHEPESKFPSYPLYEIEQVARKLENIFAELWPITYKAFNENGRVGP